VASNWRNESGFIPLARRVLVEPIERCGALLADGRLAPVSLLRIVAQVVLQLQPALLVARLFDLAFSFALLVLSCCMVKSTSIVWRSGWL